jgi:hypothetical protein
MGADVARWAPDIVAAYDWGALGTVVDVGGGDGSLLFALLEAFPNLRGTVFDRPATAEAARRRLARSGVADRAGAAGGDFFDSVPSGAGGYLLTAIIHDWDDGSARTILQQCSAAASASAGARVFVIEKIGTDGEHAGTHMDLRLLAYMGGEERGLARLTELVESADLAVVDIHRAGSISIVEARPAR